MWVRTVAQHNARLTHQVYSNMHVGTYSSRVEIQYSQAVCHCRLNITTILLHIVPVQ